MRCPACQHPDSRVVDSRDVGDSIRRRRSCLRCGHRFSTLERLELRLPWVVKKDGRREPFSRDKVFAGLALACRKRPVDTGQLTAVVSHVEQALVELREPEIPTATIGELVMAELERLDPVAFVRFASVYRQFESVEQFAAVLPARAEGR